MSLPPMSKKIAFAKIIETERHQVLITKDLDDDGDYVVRIRTSFPGVDPAISVGFGSMEARDECFDTYGPEQANLFIEEITKIMGKS